MVGRVRRYLILNIILRHNFFQSFASIGRVDLVIDYCERACRRFQEVRGIGAILSDRENFAKAR